MARQSAYRLSVGKTRRRKYGLIAKIVDTVLKNDKKANADERTAIVQETNDG
jgi:hypothetical protein